MSQSDDANDKTTRPAYFVARHPPYRVPVIGRPDTFKIATVKATKD